MSDYRGKRRPLILFAKDATDPRLVRQLEQVRQMRSGFEQRDMALLVVLEEGSSRADGRDLAVADAERLRRRYGVEAGEFALRLVGKDGGVKRWSTDLVPMISLYALIDLMPVRRSEMADVRVPAAPPRR